MIAAHSLVHTRGNVCTCIIDGRTKSRILRLTRNGFTSCLTLKFHADLYSKSALALKGAICQKRYEAKHEKSDYQSNFIQKCRPELTSLPTHPRQQHDPDRDL